MKRFLVVALSLMFISGCAPNYEVYTYETNCEGAQVEMDLYVAKRMEQVHEDLQHLGIIKEYYERRAVELYCAVETTRIR